MSYRTRVNGVQIFGNNDYYDEWIDFIKSQGIKVDEDGCYEGEITDFMGAMIVLEKIVISLNAKREEQKQRFGKSIGRNRIVSLFDFTNNINSVITQDANEKVGASVLDELFDIIETSYAFIPYVFYQACEEDLEPMDSYSTANHFHCFRLQNNKTIHVKAS